MRRGRAAPDPGAPAPAAAEQGVGGGQGIHRPPPSPAERAVHAARGPAPPRPVDEHARALAVGIRAALPGWVAQSVERLLVAYRGSADPTVMASAREAATAAAADIGDRVGALLAADIDEQQANPLYLLREAVRYPTEVLRSAGVPPVERDRFAEERFPDDDYDLTPASFADIDPDLLPLGLAWGAAKAWEHRRRHAPSPGRSS